jgi:Raf kinase inhibitor-like YbhB/YbcL family protein
VGARPGRRGVGRGESAPREGENDFGTPGYRGPCPPPGHGRHRYVFRLYALDTELELGAGAAKAELERAIEEHVLTIAELVGTYER